MMMIPMMLISLVGLTQENEDPKPGRHRPPSPEQQREFRAMHDAFLTRELDLSVKESQEFWPVYNEFLKKREALKNQKMELLKNRNSETDHEAMLAQLNEIDGNEYKLKVEYTQKLIPIIGAKRVIELERCERDFKRLLLRRIRENGPH